MLEDELVVLVEYLEVRQFAFQLSLAFGLGVHRIGELEGKVDYFDD